MGIPPTPSGSTWCSLAGLRSQAFAPLATLGTHSALTSESSSACPLFTWVHATPSGESLHTGLTRRMSATSPAETPPGAAGQVGGSQTGVVPSEPKDTSTGPAKCSHGTAPTAGASLSKSRTTAAVPMVGPQVTTCRQRLSRGDGVTTILGNRGHRGPGYWRSWMWYCIDQAVRVPQTRKRAKKLTRRDLARWRMTQPDEADESSHHPETEGSLRVKSRRKSL